MILALIALRSIRVPTKPIVIYTPTKPTDAPVKPVLFQNDDEEEEETYYVLERDPEATGANKLKLKKIIKKVQKAVDIVDEENQDRNDWDSSKVTLKHKKHHITYKPIDVCPKSISPIGCKIILF
ncbi:hypothetical protein GPJ56_002557 [Histomonas meleagridis]|uniref:uncharacterized protein n=1 Tax=Histomonas meleagridis TaxID=135588 RepID=UPI0035599D71|nr:hypothetical protein GPJ56_002557 [Histomonas meleagridis]KAH0801349.1 hypothetical protein GO595_005944 [Histomonas meleagridis]